MFSINNIIFLLTTAAEEFSRNQSQKLIIPGIIFSVGAVMLIMCVIFQNIQRKQKLQRAEKLKRERIKKFSETANVRYGNDTASDDSVRVKKIVMESPEQISNFNKAPNANVPSTPQNMMSAQSNASGNVSNSIPGKAPGVMPSTPSVPSTPSAPSIAPNMPNLNNNTANIPSFTSAPSIMPTASNVKAPMPLPKPMATGEMPNVSDNTNMNQNPNANVNNSVASSNEMLNGMGQGAIKKNNGEESIADLVKKRIQEIENEKRKELNKDLPQNNNTNNNTNINTSANVVADNAQNNNTPKTQSNVQDNKPASLPSMQGVMPSVPNIPVANNENIAPKLETNIVTNNENSNEIINKENINQKESVNAAEIQSNDTSKVEKKKFKFEYVPDYKPGTEPKEIKKISFDSDDSNANSQSKEENNSSIASEQVEKTEDVNNQIVSNEIKENKDETNKEEKINDNKENIKTPTNTHINTFANINQIDINEDNANENIESVNKVKLEEKNENSENVNQLSNQIKEDNVDINNDDNQKINPIKEVDDLKTQPKVLVERSPEFAALESKYEGQQHKESKKEIPPEIQITRAPIVPKITSKKIDYNVGYIREVQNKLNASREYENAIILKEEEKEKLKQEYLEKRMNLQRMKAKLEKEGELRDEKQKLSKEQISKSLLENTEKGVVYTEGVRVSLFENIPVKTEATSDIEVKEESKNVSDVNAKFKEKVNEEVTEETNDNLNEVNSVNEVNNELSNEVNNKFTNENIESKKDETILNNASQNSIDNSQKEIKEETKINEINNNVNNEVKNEVNNDVRKTKINNQTELNTQNQKIKSQEKENLQKQNREINENENINQNGTKVLEILENNIEEEKVDNVNNNEANDERLDDEIKKFAKSKQKSEVLSQIESLFAHLSDKDDTNNHPNKKANTNNTNSTNNNSNNNSNNNNYNNNNNVTNNVINNNEGNVNTNSINKNEEKTNENANNNSSDNVKKEVQNTSTTSNNANNALNKLNEKILNQMSQSNAKVERKLEEKVAIDRKRDQIKEVVNKAKDAENAVENAALAAGIVMNDVNNNMNANRNNVNNNNNNNNNNKQIQKQKFEKRKERENVQDNEPKTKSILNGIDLDKEILSNKAKTLSNLKQAPNYKKIIVVVSPESCGKTTVAVNLAYELANRGLNVALIDTDNVKKDIYYYIHQEHIGCLSRLNECDSAEEMYDLGIKLKDNFTVFTENKGIEFEINYSKLYKLISYAEEVNDAVIIDVKQSLGQEKTKDLLKLSTNILFVIDKKVPTLNRVADKFAKVKGGFINKDVTLVINMDEGRGINRQAIKSLFRHLEYLENGIKKSYTIRTGEIFTIGYDTKSITMGLISQLPAVTVKENKILADIRKIASHYYNG